MADFADPAADAVSARHNGETAVGNIPPVSLDARAGNDKDMARPAQVGVKFVDDKTPDSSTPARLFFQNAMRLGAGAGGLPVDDRGARRQRLPRERAAEQPIHAIGADQPPAASAREADERTMYSHCSPNRTAVKATVAIAPLRGKVGSAHWAKPTSTTPTNAATMCELRVMGA